MRYRVWCGVLAAALLSSGCESFSPDPRPGSGTPVSASDPAAGQPADQIPQDPTDPTDPEGGPPPEESVAAGDRAPFIEGTLILQLTPAVSDSIQQQLAAGVPFDQLQWPSSLKELHQLHGATAIQPVFSPELASPQRLTSLRQQYAQRHRGSDQPGVKQLPRLDTFYALTVDLSLDLDEASQAYEADDSVLSAELDRIAMSSTLDTWGNPFDQWGLFKLNAPAVWGGTTGAGINVAVIDTGVDLVHPDLAPNLLPGASFVPGAPTPQDDNGHGSHVAGIIAAVANNAQGIAGAAPGAKIFPVKALSSWGGGYLSWLSNGYMWAMGTGVTDVINNSWGGAGSSPLFDSLIRTASLLGIVTVNAAGNSNAPVYGFFPANVEYGLAVAATDVADARAPYSNQGIQLDVAAPGGTASGSFTTGILSTVPPFFTGAGTVTDSGAKYSPLAGTSMAAPHVSALAALLAQAHPTWNVEQLRQAIRKGAVDVDAAGFDANTGWGRVSAPGSLAVPAPPIAQIVLPRNDSAVFGPAVPVRGYSMPSPFNTSGWQLWASPGTSMTTWTLVSTGTAPVTVYDAPVTTFNSLAFPDGDLVLKLVTTNTSGGMTAEDRNVIKLQNVRITTPVEGAHLTASMVSVGGRVQGAGLVSWKLDWAPGYGATSGFTTFFTSTSPVPGGLLSPWSLAPVPEGEVSLRLTATFTSHTTVHQINVVVDKRVLPGFPAPIYDPAGQKTPKIVDLEGDGQKELVVGGSVYRANGTLKPGWNVIPGLGRTVQAIANVDSAPDKEVIVAKFESYFYDGTLPGGGATVITAYKPNKTVLWTYPVLQIPGPFHNGTPSSLSVGNVTGDGRPEVVFTQFFAYANPGAQTTVFVLDGSTGAPIHRYNLPGISWSSVALADLDSDGYQELVLETYDNSLSVGRVYALRASGTPMPGWPQVSPSSQGFADISPVIGDVDGDCRFEILVGQKLYQNNGLAYPGWPVGLISRSTSLMANWDTDAQLELSLGGGNAVTGWGMQHTGALSIAMINSFENLYVFGFNENYKQGNPIAADVDGDGRVDIIRQDELGTTNPLRAIPIYVYDVLSGAKKPQTRRVRTTEPGGAWSFPAYSTAAVGDLNGDGLLDMAVVARNRVWAWNMGVPYVPSMAPWPMYQRDYFNTGTVPLAGACVTPFLRRTPDPR